MIENEYIDNDDVNLYLDKEYKGLTKKGKARKRKPKEPRIYFTKDTEEAIIEYLKTEDEVTRNKIYNEKIEYAFYKLVENIIHTFKFYYTDTDTIEELKHEVITFLLEKLHLYDQSKGAAFSYFGTIAKRYLINYNENNYQKLQKKIDTSDIDEELYDLKENAKDNTKTTLTDFFDYYVKYLDVHLTRIFPKTKDAQTADAILQLFRKRETLEIFNKKALYVYIREITDVDTPQITKIIKKLKTIYVTLYNEYYEHGTVKI